MFKKLLLVSTLTLQCLAFSQDCSIALNIPYSENFQASTSFPACVTTENADGINPVWAINSSTDINMDGTIDRFATVAANSNTQVNKDDWMFSTKISFVAGTAYVINVKFNAFNIGNVTANQKFTLYMTNSASSGATNKILIGNYDNITQNGVFQANDGSDLLSLAYNTGSNFTPTTSGDYYIAIHANKIGNSAPLFVFEMSASVNLSNLQHLLTVDQLYNLHMNHPGLV